MARLVHLGSPSLCTFRSAYCCLSSTENTSQEYLQHVQSCQVWLCHLLGSSIHFGGFRHYRQFELILVHNVRRQKAVSMFDQVIIGGPFLLHQSRRVISTTHKCDIGVPQGSVLSQLLFSLFTTPLGDIICPFSVKFH